MAIFLQYHRHNIRTSCSSPATHYNTTAYTDNHRTNHRSQHQMVGHIQTATQQLCRVQLMERFFRRIGEERQHIHGKRSE